jgi:hypothetical protein
VFNLQQFIVDSHRKIIAHYRELLETSTSNGERDHIESLIEKHERSLQRELDKLQAPRRLKGRQQILRPHHLTCMPPPAAQPAALSRRMSPSGTFETCQQVPRMSAL